MDTLLLNTAYFPPVEYFSKIKQYENVCIEQYESYGKQSYRNRCEIMFANGIMSLVVPITKAPQRKMLIKDTLIDYAVKWQKLHFKSIESAYKNSPYYDYYIDDLATYFEKKEKFLLDMNGHILKTMLNLLDMKKKLSLTNDYIKETSTYCDLRNTIHPKKTINPDFIAKPYHQTFSERFPFTPNLSILDLLFNAGPDAADYL